MDIDRRNNVAIDLADKHHPRHIKGVGVGNPQAIFEFGRDAEPLKEVADLRASTMHDNNPDAHRMQQDNVGRE